MAMDEGDSSMKVGIQGDARGFSTAMSQAERALHSFGGMLQNIGGALGSVGSIVQGFASGGVMGAVTAAVNEAIEALQECLETYKNFETALINVSSASGLAGEELEKLKEDLQEAAMAAGVDFGVGATEAMKAMESLVKAGLEGQDAIEALNAALALSKVEGMDTAESANLLVGIMGMYAMSAEEAAHATDVLANASIAGVGTAAEFARGLSYVGGRAAQLGFSLEETTAALVALNNQGIEATTAGQSLNMMFTSLIQRSDELGFSLYDNQGNMLSLAQIIGNLTDHLNSMGSQEERNAYLTNIFGARAGRAAAALLNLGESGEEVTESINLLTQAINEGGTAMDIVEQKSDTLAGTQARLDAIFENMQIRIGEALAPIMERFAAFMEDVLVPALEGFIPILTGILDAVGGLIDFFTDLATIIGNTVGPAFEWLGSVLKPVGDALAWVGNAVADFFGGIVQGVSDTADAIREAEEEIQETSQDTVDTMQDEVDEYRMLAAEHRRAMALMRQQAAEAAAEIEESFDDMSDAVAESMQEIFQQGHDTFDMMVTDVNDLIKSGLLGDAQDAIHDFVDCSLTKQADMVDEIDGYMEDLREEYADNMAKIRDLQSKGLYREAELLMKRNNEITAKMDQLLAWRNMLINQQWDSTTEAMRQALMEQFGLAESYYQDLFDLDKRFFPDEDLIREPDIPIDKIVDPRMRDLPIDAITPMPTPIIGEVHISITEPILSSDAEQFAKDIMNHLRTLQEEDQRQRGYIRSV